MPFILRPKILKSIFLFVFLATFLPLLAQTPPEKVAVIFKSDYPDATKVKWSNTELIGKEFKVQFTSGKTKFVAFYNASGKLMETERPIKPKMLPESVTKALDTQFGKYKIVQCYAIERNGNAELYDIAIKSDGIKSNQMVSKDGFFTVR